MAGSGTLEGADGATEPTRDFDLTLPWLGVLGAPVVFLIGASVVAGTVHTTAALVIAIVVAVAALLSGWRYAKALCRRVSIRPDRIEFTHLISTDTFAPDEISKVEVNTFGRVSVSIGGRQEWVVPPAARIGRDIAEALTALAPKAAVSKRLVRPFRP